MNFVNIVSFATRRGVRTKAVVITMALVCTLFSGFALAGQGPSQYCSDGANNSEIHLLNDPITFNLEPGTSFGNPNYFMTCYSTTPYGSGDPEVTGGAISVNTPTQNGASTYCFSDPAAMVRLDCAAGTGLNTQNPTAPSASAFAGGQATVLGTPVPIPGTGAGVQTGCNYGYTAGTGGVGCGNGGPASRFSQWCADGASGGGSEGPRVLHDPVTLDFEQGSSYFQTCYSTASYNGSNGVPVTGGVAIVYFPYPGGAGLGWASDPGAMVQTAGNLNTFVPPSDPNNAVVGYSLNSSSGVLGNPVPVPNHSVYAGTGCASGTIAISTSSCANGELLGASGQGYAGGSGYWLNGTYVNGVAASGTGDSSAGVLAASGTGCTGGNYSPMMGATVSGTNCSWGGLVGISGLGSSGGTVLSAGGTGCSWGQYVMVNATGCTDGSMLGISGAGTANASGDGTVLGVAISGTNAATGRDAAVGGGSGSGGVVGIGVLETGSGSIASVSGGDAAVTVGGVTITDPCQQLPEVCLVSIPINPVDDHNIIPPPLFDAESVLSFIDESMPNPGTNSAASSGGNPYGCWGRSDNPHISSHSGGQRVSAQGTTYCTSGVPYLFVESLLYRSRWYGWEKLEHKSTSCNGNNCRERYVNPSWACNFEQEHNFWIASYHKIRGWNGKIYDGHTERAIRLRC